MKKFIVVVGCTFGLLFSLLGANDYLVASDVDASTVSHKTGNYTIDKILSSYEGEKFSKSDNFFSDLERFYRAFFMWILQNNFSKLGQHEAIVSITCKKL